jgi:hypothetical protein
MIHLVFHVYLLKKAVGDNHQVSTELPITNDAYQVPEEVLQRRIQQRGDSSVSQVLIKWSRWASSLATWEDEAVLVNVSRLQQLGIKPFLKEGGMSRILLHLLASLKLTTRRWNRPSVSQGALGGPTHSTPAHNGSVSRDDCREEANYLKGSSPSCRGRKLLG